MPVSAIDTTPALVVIDLQKGILTVPSVHPMADVIDRSARLARAFRAHGLPVVLVNVDAGAPGRTEVGRSRLLASPPADWTEIVAELDPQPSDLRVTKQTWGAFHRTPLHERLQELGVTQIVLTGVSTSSGVETTARAAYEHGYHVVLATDAMTDSNAVAHENSVSHIFPKLGETGTTEAILDLLGSTR